MAAKLQKPKGDKPPFDPHKLLGQLKDIVGNNKKSSGGGKSWIGTLIILAAVLVGIAIWSWISFRRGRELAKLRHAENKRKYLLAQEIFEEKIAENDAEIAEAAKRAEAGKEKLRSIWADIRAEEARYEADMRAIDSIRSWRDAGIR